MYYPRRTLKANPRNQAAFVLRSDHEPRHAAATCHFHRPPRRRAVSSPPLHWDGANVLELLELEHQPGDEFLCRYNEANMNGHLFGGQVLGQALAACTATITGLTLHSLHSYFLRPGAVDERVSFAVERTRDGRRFATRRVIARQSAKPIFAMTCSFFHPQTGYEHFTPAPAAPDPDGLENLAQIIGASGLDVSGALGKMVSGQPIEVRPVTGRAVLTLADKARLRYWVRVPSAAGTADPVIHQRILAYLSDYWLIASGMVTHRQPFIGRNMEVASLDHAMWFHRPARCDEWLLYDTESPSARDGINLSRGLIYDRAGALIATVAQESLQALIT